VVKGFSITDEGHEFIRADRDFADAIQPISSHCHAPSRSRNLAHVSRLAVGFKRGSI
jgi:hypothetical protein